MKKNYTYPLYTLVAGMLTVSSAWTQHNNEFYNNGSLVHVQAGAEVHVLGDVHMRGATGTLENNGLIQVHGDMYGDNLFQQRGTGTTRIQNNLVNAGAPQKISGSYAVRGTGSANKGVNDGSFYNLELANDVGIVWLETNGIAGSTPYVADVRNGVDFWLGAGTTQNRIITMNYASVVPNTTDGPAYNAIFGIMNPAAVFGMPWGEGGMRDNSTDLGGSNMSTVDAGYVQGKLRRQLDPAGGLYPFVLGLEPNGAGAQRGMQYIQLSFGANTYDVIESYFDCALPTTPVGAYVNCPGNYQVDYWGGVDHGQWIFDDPNGGAGTYSAIIWPQDDNFPAKTVWFITKDNDGAQGTLNECAASPIALSRTGFNGFSSIGVVASDLLLETELIDLKATAINNSYIRVDWEIEEKDVDYYIVERSTDDANFEYLTTQTAAGTSGATQLYHIDDYAVLPNINYYYRIKVVNIDGSSNYTHSVVASLHQSGQTEDVRVYPNPTKGGDVTVEITSVRDRDVRFVVYDAIGQRIHQSNATMQVGLNQYTLYTKDWPSGAYFIHITGDEFSSIQELIKRQD